MKHIAAGAVHSLRARAPRALRSWQYTTTPHPYRRHRTSQVPINRDDFDAALRALAVEADPVVSVNRHMITVK